MRACSETQTSHIAALNQSCDAVAGTRTANERLAPIVVIDRRPLLRECFVRGLTSVSGETTISFASAEHWIEASDGVSASMILFFTGAGSKFAETHQEMALLLRSAGQPPVIVVSDKDDSAQIVEMLDMGVRGYVATSSSLSEVLGAIRLVNAGGLFVPASSLEESRQSTDADVSKSAQNGASLTPRQTAVLRALRQGKPNKAIAYELCMAESTVKVHVRNMMKKFRVTNRTQLAFLAGRQQSALAMAETDQNTPHGGREPESQGSRRAAA